MELVGGWVYSPVKWGIAYNFKNIYSSCIIGVSLWTVIKIFFSIDAKTQLGYDLFLHLTLSALFLAGFINACMAYTKCTAIPNFLNLSILSLNTYGHVPIHTREIATYLFAWLLLWWYCWQQSTILLGWHSMFASYNPLALILRSPLIIPTWLSGPRW